VSTVLSACVMREGMLKIIAIGRDEIGIIRTLWEGLNDYHLSKSTYFKKHFSEFTFEKRMEGLDLTIPRSSAAG
jgi:hypothetical protein